MATVTIPGQLGMSTPLGELLGASTAELEAEFADYKALGVDWVRTNFWWDVAKPTASSGYDWTLMDRVVTMAQKYGIEIIAELDGNPRWTDLTMSTASARQAYVDYVAAAAAHFGDRVDHWEVWNEPNMRNITPANYTKMLQGAYAAIKAVDAGDTVISGGTAATPQTGGGLYGAVDYLKQMYAAGAKGYFDAVGFHPYTYPLLPNDPAPWNGWQIMEDGIRGTMVANGDGAKQIWMTELGAPTGGGGNAISQATQATIIQQATQLAAGYSWAGPILWYSYKDRGGSTGTVENWFGLVGPDGARKQAYFTYQAIATTQEGAVSGGSGTPGATFVWPNFTGSANADTIVGNDQNNTIWGEGGGDTINGGRGDDQLYGGSGTDVFVFTDRTTMGRDILRDFQTGDRIDLRALDADTTRAGDQAFAFVGSAWLSRPGDLGAYRDAAGHVSIQGDVNGDGIFDFSIRVDGTRSFAAGDFLL